MLFGCRLALVWGSPSPPGYPLPQVSPRPRCWQWPGATCWDSVCSATGFKAELEMGHPRANPHCSRLSVAAFKLWPSSALAETQGPANS